MTMMRRSRQSQAQEQRIPAPKTILPMENHPPSNSPPPAADPAPGMMEDAPPNPENPDIKLYFIAGGPGCGGESSSLRKQYPRMVASVQETAPLKRRRPSTPVCFSDEDLRGIYQPHDDALVVAVKVGVFTIYKVLVDTGSTTDIIFWDCFERMKIGKENLKQVRSHLVGFDGNSRHPKGMISLAMTLGTPPQAVTAMIDFLILRCPSSYNAIVGRPSLCKLAIVPSPYHQKLKFQTEEGNGEVRGDQASSRECYSTLLRYQTGESSRAAETLTLEEL
ncbi:hypothetical protein J5N97_021862 [Dioscorea zingiberensis]|uniref:Peptidase A2 domain-containing protein n=1 Tax=Dioscorea zingiberensis TaxID=325984 RepID=A0A9D5HAB6_9LILI|nr:hypothetical protein J5N97_021862 [Dioscorea zingiberensis]